ncbi:MAG: hypothetical protein JJE44_14155 [Flavobacteriaceae bacterium]|nr:hypothetical protein [Flavobacteriaceae bacterium]
MMKTKNLLAVLILAMAGLSTMNAQEMDHSKMKKDTAKMEMDHSKMQMMDMKKDSIKMNMDHSNMKMMDMKMDQSKIEMKQDSMKMANTYACPMHADVKSDKPGACPKCGMDLKKMDVEEKDIPKKHKHQ